MTYRNSASRIWDLNLRGVDPNSTFDVSIVGNTLPGLVVHDLQCPGKLRTTCSLVRVVMYTVKNNVDQCSVEFFECVKEDL